MCVDDAEMMAEDVVGMYAEQASQSAACVGIVDDTDAGSPSEKRRRRCLSECDVNAGGLADIVDGETVAAADSHGVSACPVAEAGNCAPIASMSPQKRFDKETCAAMPSDSYTTSAAAAVTDATTTTTVTQKRVNKENRVVVADCDTTASAVTGTTTTTTSTTGAVGDGEASKLPSPTFKSPPPPRRNVFAQSKDGSVARQRFNVNATRDTKLASPEPIVEVRSRSVTTTVYSRMPAYNALIPVCMRVLCFTTLHMFR